MISLLGSLSIFAMRLNDITISQYQTSIINLANKGIIDSETFNPSEKLTKVEAAALLQRVFKLATIPTKITEETKNTKK